MAAVKDPVLLDFPDSMETERLLIRRCQPGDGAAVFAAIQESFEHLAAWFPWVGHQLTLDNVESGIRTAVANWHTREDMRMHIYRKEDGLFVGGTGLHRIKWDVPLFEIGYWVRATLQGQGYITETVLGLTDFVFRELGGERIEIRCDARNDRSASVARRAGYTFEGKLRSNSRDVKGALCDSLVFALLRREWQPASSSSD